MPYWLGISVGVLALAALVAWARQRSQRLRAEYRLAASSLAGTPLTGNAADAGIPDAGLARWLYLAGDRRPDATLRFWFRTVLLGVLGILIGGLLWFTGVTARMTTDLTLIPGRVGYLFVPVVHALPVLLMLFMAAVPAVRVRRQRRARVRVILRDLYPVLELFASLAQAGLAFDGALARIVPTLGPERPLGREFMTFQAEIMSGADRTQCFRRFARRIELPQIGSLTSALIRAQEAGIGLADTLRRQADDLRGDLRERALARAQSLPARLVFPLVLCFLPGIFVMSLGPAFYGFLVGTAGFGNTR
ncbi:MAG: type II secretion system F family protein [bacterium]|nr:type II secretion system F family protein [bacterium]